MLNWPIIDSLFNLVIIDPTRAASQPFATKCFKVSLSEKMDEGRIPSPDQIIASI
jgi:hypothetical protein